LNNPNSPDVGLPAEILLFITSIPKTILIWSKRVQKTYWADRSTAYMVQEKHKTGLSQGILLASRVSVSENW